MLPLLSGRLPDRCTRCGAQQVPGAAPFGAAQAPGGFGPPPGYGGGFGPAPIAAQPRKQSSGGCIALVVLGLLVALAGGGAAVWLLLVKSPGRADLGGDPATAANDDDAPATREGDRASPGGPAPAPGDAPKSQGSGPQGDYFASASAVGEAIATKFTRDAELKELVLYPGYAIFELRDPVKRNNVDRHVLRPSGFEAPSPVRLVGDDESELDQQVFRIREVDFNVVPRLVDDARTQMAVEEAKVTHIIIDKFFPFRKKLGFRVYVSSDRAGGYVDYDAKGNKIKVIK